MRRVLVFLVAVSAMISTASAQDFIEVDGKLTDDQFYNLVACDAVPDGPCRFDPVRWAATDAQDLTISIYQKHPSYDTYDAASDALNNAVAQINSAGAAVQLRRLVDGADAHITVYLSGFDSGSTIDGIGLKGVDGSTVYDAYFHIFWNGRRELTRGVVIFSKDLDRDEIEPVMLEEVVQSLGLLKDVRADWYETRSIFSEDSNLVTAISGQDAIVLRRHYPAQN